MRRTMIRRYVDLKRLPTFEERFEYLRLDGRVGDPTFGYDRYLNQILYRTDRWLKARDQAIIRDEACDLGIEGREIHDRIYVHHMNPITIEDIEEGRDEVFQLRFLICTSFDTHQAIHYGNGSKVPQLPIERTRHDTSPWRH